MHERTRRDADDDIAVEAHTLRKRREGALKNEGLEVGSDGARGVRRVRNRRYHTG